MPGRVLGGCKAVLSLEERLAKLEASAAYGGKHVPVPRNFQVRAVEMRRGGRIKTLADITSKLKNETVSSKNKKA